MSKYERTVKIAHFEENTKLLGPYDRFVIWVHGCCFDCKGCLADDYKNGAYQEYTISELAEKILLSDIEGITISGGEPFLQAEALAELIFRIRQKKNIGVIIYSGFTLEELKEKNSAQKLLKNTDILIDGRYIQELDDNRAYIGSSNQKIHYLTERYLSAGKEYYQNTKRKIEIKLFPDKAVMIGVPSKEQLNTWNDLKKQKGRHEN